MASSKITCEAFSLIQWDNFIALTCSKAKLALITIPPYSYLLLLVSFCLLPPFPPLGSTLKEGPQLCVIDQNKRRTPAIWNPFYSTHLLECSPFFVTRHRLVMCNFLTWFSLSLLQDSYMNSKVYPIIPRYKMLKDMIKSAMRDPNYMEVCHEAHSWKQ